MGAGGEMVVQSMVWGLWALSHRRGGSMHALVIVSSSDSKPGTLIEPGPCISLRCTSLPFVVPQPLMAPLFELVCSLHERNGSWNGRNTALHKSPYFLLISAGYF